MYAKGADQYEAGYFRIASYKAAINRKSAVRVVEEVEAVFCNGMGVCSTGQMNHRVATC